MRRRAQRALTAHLPQAEGALLRGMVLGDDAALDMAERSRLRRSGLGHLVASSGANVALLAVLALAACALLGVGLRARLVAVAVLIALYVPLAGAGPSIRRAGVMGVAGIVATLSARPQDRRHAVLLAVVVTLGLDPHSVSDPGWQLSFAAVAGIAVLGAPLLRLLRARGVPRRARRGRSADARRDDRHGPGLRRGIRDAVARRHPGQRRRRAAGGPDHLAGHGRLVRRSGLA